MLSLNGDMRRFPQRLQHSSGYRLYVAELYAAHQRA
jgi:hypothetical protein